MSKELEALERIIETFYDKDSEDIQIVRKALKALEIIKENHVQIGWFTKLLKIHPNYTEGEYNFGLPDNMKLSEEEYKLLKEVLA